MRTELLLQANGLMRGYLLRRQIDAVKLTYQLVPADSVALLTEQWESRTGLTELSPQVDSTIREYLCVKTYLDALDAFQDWFTRFHHSKPKKAAAGSTGRVANSSTQVSFTDNLLKEQQNRQHQTELTRWQAAVESLTQSAVDKLYNVLLFPNGGWMADSTPIEEEDTPRQLQLALLRQSCIPHAALLLCNVLTSTKRFEECLELANVMASEQQSLYKVCSSEQLVQLNKHLRQAFVKVIDSSSAI